MELTGEVQADLSSNNPSETSILQMLASTRSSRFEASAQDVFIKWPSLKEINYVSTQFYVNTLLGTIHSALDQLQLK